MSSRKIIEIYFEKLVFIKVDKKEEYTIYGAAINSSFGDGKKEYVLLFVPAHLGILDRARIGDLHWKSLQTRLLTNTYKLKPQKWEIPRGLQSPMFNIVHRDEERSKYILEGYVNHELEMILKHDPKKKTKMQYHNKMNIVAALGTFRCIIVLNDAPINFNQPVERALMQKYTPPGPTGQTSLGDDKDDIFLPQQNIVCDNKYCYYQAEDGSLSAPIQGYQKVGFDYGQGALSGNPSQKATQMNTGSANMNFTNTGNYQLNQKSLHQDDDIEYL